MGVRVRFAPSPTGNVHIGNLRAAIFNWLFARHEKGAFLLRIEDTDRERSTDEAIVALMESLEWARLDWDEEPVYQTSRLDSHKAAAKALMDNGAAYMAAPRTSQWAFFKKNWDIELPDKITSVLENFSNDDGTMRRRHQELFEEANSKRPKKKQKRYFEPLSFTLIEQGDEALYFRLPLPWVESKHIRETDEVCSIPLCAEWPVLINLNGVEFIRASKVKNNPPFEMLPFEVEQASLCGFAGMELLDDQENALWRIGDYKAELESGKLFAIQGVDSIRFKRRYTVFNDIVKGDLAKPLDGLNNRVIARSDGTPLFHLANVVDDHDMGITHILRGDDHVANTYWHVLLFEVLGWMPPIYGHLPMIVNDKKKPLSKRDGDVYVGEYKAKGILAEALFNYLALQGWSPGDDREKVDRNEMVELFSIDRVIATPARFDMAKLLWLNGKYLAEMDPLVFIERATPFLEKDGLSLQGRDEKWLRTLGLLLRERVETLAGFPGAVRLFFADPGAPDLENKKVRKLLGQDGLKGVVSDLASELGSLEPFVAESIEKILHDYAEKNDLGMGKVSQPLRLAVSGGLVSPPIGATLELIGKEAVLRRIDTFLSFLDEKGGS